MNWFGNAKSWPLVPLKDISTLKRGYDLPVSQRNSGNVPIYAANGKNGSHDDVKIKAPGVITGRSGTIGKVHYTEEDYWPLNTALYVTNFHGNNPRWVYYMLQSFKLDRFVEGAGVPTLNRNLVHGELVPLPPLPEQKRIAAILDAADALRTQRRQSIAELDLLLQSTFLEMFGDPVENPKGWEVKKLTETAQVKGGFAFKSDDYLPEKNGVPLIRIGEVNRQDFDGDKIMHLPIEFIEKYDRFIIKDGALLMSLTGTIGKNDYGNVTLLKGRSEKYFLNQRVAEIKPNKSIDKNFLFHYLRNKDVKNMLVKNDRGVRQANISNKDIQELSLIVPPQYLQNQYAMISKSIELQKLRLNKHLLELDTLFASLQQRAFNGEL
ncbi:restriction endonuclease subunit S [Thiothrix unzii]|uniref:Restriction endonuclease subunit S n=1 Tax=Thiothrix unzii TaxID=111769 RepID=A0A975FBJ1_9GAMM|nr:restriction endonuclease subunit S [Thiothrix unzii]QTR54792.1 restriction endonuclease subunit S [Thiothrix unzii]